MNRWAKRGVRDRVVAPLHHTQILRVTLEAVAVDRTLVQVHPDGTGALKHTARPPWVGPAAEGRPRCIWLPRLLERAGMSDRGSVTGLYTVLAEGDDMQDPIADTVRSFKELLEGKWDHLPEQAFMYVGTIEQAAAKAEKL